MPRRAQQRLTDEQVRKLAPKAQRYEVKDGGAIGLAVVVQPSGVRSWFLRYGAKQERRVRIGDAGSMSVDRARREARKLRVEIDGGGDPATERRQAKVEALALKARAASIEAGDVVPGTVAELAVRYLRASKRRMKPRGFAEVERHIAHIVAAWGSRELVSIRRKDVVELVERRRDDAAAVGRHEDANRRGIVPAARLLAAIGTLFAFAVNRDELPANPAHGLRRADLALEESPRERVLADDEIRTLWLALDALPALYAGAYRLILLSALRPGEVLSLRWASLQDDAHGRFALLTASDTKAGAGRRVPLSPQAVAVLEQVRALGYDSEFVFPSGGASGHLQNPKAITSRLLTATGLARFTPHDLRRTARTLLGSLGVRHEVAERLIGHMVGSEISRVYDRHAYDAEQQAAANLLGERLAEITKREVHGA